MNIQGWSPLGLIGLTSLHSKGTSRVFSSTTVWHSGCQQVQRRHSSISTGFGARIFCHHFSCLPQGQLPAKPACKCQGEAAQVLNARDPLPLLVRPRATLSASAWVPLPAGSTSSSLSIWGWAQLSGAVETTFHVKSARSEQGKCSNCLQGASMWCFWSSWHFP